MLRKCGAREIKAKAGKGTALNSNGDVQYCDARAMMRMGVRRY